MFLPDLLEFKLAALARMGGALDAAGLAVELGIDRGFLLCLILLCLGALE
jgi:hypothetical protein